MDILILILFVLSIIGIAYSLKQLYFGEIVYSKVLKYRLLHTLIFIVSLVILIMSVNYMHDIYKRINPEQGKHYVGRIY